MMHFKRRAGDQRGYVLPATIILGLAVAMVSITLLQTTAISSQNLNRASYQADAQDAANAGLALVQSCVKNSQISWTTLTPQTGCDGTSNGSTNTAVTQQGSDWISSFSVGTPAIDANGLLTALSTGTTKLYNSGTLVSTFTAKAKITLPSTPTTRPVALGTPITAIKNDATDCAIANGKLYCWGDNSSGQIGDGTTTTRTTPTLVAGALAGKTVTKVSVAYTSVCAIADGTPYCWGDNANSQLGDGTTTSRFTPTANVPKTSSGPLNGQFVTDIGTASANNPASLIWPFALASPHSCALTQNGAVSCWGDGGFRQNTGGGMTYVIVVPTGYYSYPNYSVPTLVMGYSDNSAPLAGNKTERMGASSHDSCGVVEGKMICWGVPAPINLFCTSVLFSAAWETLVPFNPCVGSFSNGYDTSTLAGSAFNGKFIDPSTWDISADETCSMANTDYVCFGTTPAYDLFWAGGYGTPSTFIANADVTDSDNGDSIPSWGSSGLYCMIDRGIAKCSASPFNPYGGNNASGYMNIQPLVTTSGLAGKVPTKIAAGQDHGCVVANGQLLCWGNQGSGRLADGVNNAFGNVSYATLTGTTGATPIGTTNGTYAASGPISVGGDFGCGIVNGNVYCWGKNSNGQLGTGNTTSLSQPQVVKPLLASTATKVTAGANHACALVDGKAYCWGSNSDGQIGNGTSGTNVTTPYQVAGLLSGKRVTDISAGYNSTCATANGQAYCWGNNGNKKLGNGDGTFTTQTSPVLVNGHGTLTTALSTTAITVGTNHACAIANSDAYCWGSNANGETGLNTAAGNSDPTLLATGTANAPLGPNSTRPSVSGISAGSNFSCGIFNGVVSCWGDNTNGRTGLGAAKTSGNTLIPTVLSGAPGTYYATAISAGGTHACAILNGNSSATNGNTFCWGAAANGRVGNNTTTPDVSTATVIAGGDNSGKSAIGISAGLNSTCNVAKGDIQCWGLGSSGQIGNSSLASQQIPTITSDYVVSTFTKTLVY